MGWEIVALIAGFVSLGFGLYLFRWVLAQPNESEAMAEFSKSIQEGAAAYLKRLFQALGALALVIGIIIFVAIGWRNALAYLIGSACSAMAGYLGMYT